MDKLIYVFFIIVGIFLIYLLAKRIKQGRGSKKANWIILVIMALLVLGSFENIINPQKTRQSTRSNNSEVSRSSKVSSDESSIEKKTSKTIKIHQLKLGMTKKQVFEILGDPTDPNGRLVAWDKYGEFYFDKSGKLIGGSPSYIQSLVNKKIAKEKEDRKNKQNMLLGYAQSFGTKAVADIQKNTAAINSMKIDGGMEYAEAFDNGISLVRIDTDDGYTTVYQADSNTENGLGKQLYQGKTIMQKRSTIYNFYGE